MPRSRESFRNMLKEVTNIPHLYFQPPQNVKMSYPCIVYSRDSIEPLRANNAVYGSFTSYLVTVIDENPDSEYVQKMATIPQARHVRNYQADYLNHDVFKIYY